MDVYAGATVGIPPAVTEETAAFWAAAAEGRLLVEGGAACGARVFPRRGICRACRGREMVRVEITGQGRVYSFTVNYQRWLPDLEVPYAMALVEFDEHPGVRVPGRLRGCPPEETAIAMAVDIGFAPGPGGARVPGFIRAGRAAEAGAGQVPNGCDV